MRAQSGPFFAFFMIRRSCLVAFSTVVVLIVALEACAPVAPSQAPVAVTSRPPAVLDPRTATVAFYKLENLFDTVDDPQIKDEDFLPGGYKGWDESRYHTKIQNLASVIAGLGSAYGPDVLGAIEMENQQVLRDLAADPQLVEHNYQIVHFDSPDPRGIDCALLYKPGRFTVTGQRAVRQPLPDTTMGTRDLLIVNGLLLGEPITFLVCHWPSRRGGEKALNRRLTVAQQTRQVIDEQLKTNPSARLVLMGDMNDSPTDSSVLHILGTSAEMGKLPPRKLYNPFYNLQIDGKGTMYYRSRPDVFDMMVLSPGLLGGSGLRYVPNSAAIHAPVRLTSPQAKFPGEPLGSYVGRKYIGGYSDHFPVFLTLKK